MNRYSDFLINRLEQILKTDVLYLLQGGFWSIINFLMTVSFGVLVTIALANWVPKDILGTYQFILAIASILAVCTLSGMGTAITRAVAIGRDGAYRYGVLLKLKWGISVFILSAIVSLYYLLNGDVVLSLAFLIVGVATPFIESFKLYENYLRGKEAFKEGVTLGFWRKPIPLIAVSAAAFLTNDVLILIGTYFLSHLISYGIVYLQVHKKFTPEYSEDPATLTLSKHMSLVKIFSQVTSNLDKILIWHFLGPVAVATFAIAQITTRYAAGVLNSLSSIALPKIARQNYTTLQKTLPKKILAFSILMLFAAAIYFLLIPFLFSIIFPEYSESVIIAQILSVLFVLSPSKIFSQALISHDLLKAQYIITISSPIIFGVLLWFMTPLYGVTGAAIAVVMVSVYVAILNYLFFILSNPAN